MIWQPAVYHGFGKRRNFFEGWYFRLTDATEGRTYAIIPGIFLGSSRADAYSFVQTLDGRTGLSIFHRYPLEAFTAARREFHIEVGPNCFRIDRCMLAIDTPERQIQGELRFTGLVPWPVTVTSPGVMGPYAFAPYMECYHGVLSLNHHISGRLQIDGQQIDFTGGRGYTEKDWGTAFPRAWIWLQTNHFDRPGICLTASVARVPWLGSAFRGFIVGLWVGGHLYRFATYTGAQILNLEITDSQVVWEMTGRAGGRADRADYRLAIFASRAEGGLLHAPVRTTMEPRVVESLTATAGVSLWRSAGDREELIFQGSGRHAALEISGQLRDILDTRQITR